MIRMIDLCGVLTYLDIKLTGYFFGYDFPPLKTTSSFVSPKV